MTLKVWPGPARTRRLLVFTQNCSRLAVAEAAAVLAIGVSPLETDEAEVLRDVGVGPDRGFVCKVESEQNRATTTRAARTRTAPVLLRNGVPQVQG
jgi:hypothetical protein